MFNVETDFGFASASVNGKYMDAGRAGDIAGIEFSRGQDADVRSAA
jgi:hypothetical protein